MPRPSTARSIPDHGCGACPVPATKRRRRTEPIMAHPRDAARLRNYSSPLHEGPTPTAVPTPGNRINPTATPSPRTGSTRQRPPTNKNQPTTHIPDEALDLPTSAVAGAGAGGRRYPEWVVREEHIVAGQRCEQCRSPDIGETTIHSPNAPPSDAARKPKAPQPITGCGALRELSATPLARHRSGPGGSGLRIQVLPRTHRSHIFVEFIPQRNPGRDIQPRDIVVGNPVQMLHQRTQ